MLLPGISSLADIDIDMDGDEVDDMDDMDDMGRRRVEEKTNEDVKTRRGERREKQRRKRSESEDLHRPPDLACLTDQVGSHPTYTPWPRRTK